MLEAERRHGHESNTEDRQAVGRKAEYVQSPVAPLPRHSAKLTRVCHVDVLSLDSVCNSCLARLSTPSLHRTAATAAVVAPIPSVQRPATVDASGSPVAQQAYQLRAGVVVSRAPVLTRPLHPFEKAFFLYQRRLNERLALPFTRYFYYKKDTPADREWKRKAKQRLTPARDIGVYNAYGETGWNDELLVGDRTSEPEEQVEALIRDAEGFATGEEAKEGEGKAKDKSQEVEVQRPLPRITEADQKGDQTSLNRLLDRSLYLLVKNKDGRWRFPEDSIRGKEGLHQVSKKAAQASRNKHYEIERGPRRRGLTHNPDSRARYCASRRNQHEHVGRRQCAHWLLRIPPPKGHHQRREPDTRAG